MLLILIIGIFTAAVIATCIKVSNSYSDYNQSSSGIPNKYKVDDKFLLSNYMNCLQNNSKKHYYKTNPSNNRKNRRRVKPSNRDRAIENSNFTVIRGNKQG